VLSSLKARSIGLRALLSVDCPLIFCFKEGDGHALHGSNDKIPEQDGSEERRDEIEADCSYGIEVLCNKSPEHNVDGNPDEKRQYAGEVAPDDVELAKHDGKNTIKMHARISQVRG
jgi:hypothetical protein